MKNNYSNISINSANPKHATCPTVQIVPIKCTPEQARKKQFVKMYAINCGKLKKYSKNLKNWREVYNRTQNSKRRNAMKKIEWFEAQIEALENDLYSRAKKCKTTTLFSIKQG